MDGTGVRGGRRRAASAALAGTVALVGGLALAGCSSSGTTGDASALPPVIVDLGDVDGTTVEVTEGGTIDLTDDDTYAAWTADIDNPDVVEFVAGRDDGSAQFNPGLTAKSVGETDVTLDNGETGDTVTFTVDVVPKAAGGY
jgi:hypothetical protein